MNTPNYVDQFTQLHQMVTPIGKSARRDVMSRLLGLNHEMWEEEQKAEGEAQKAVGGKPKKVARKKSAGDGQIGMF